MHALARLVRQPLQRCMIVASTLERFAPGTLDAAALEGCAWLIAQRVALLDPREASQLPDRAALRSIIEMVFGPQGRSLTTPLPTGVLMLGSVRISYLHLTAALVSWVCMAGFGLFFKFTSVGLLMRASADNHEAAVVSGVNVNTMNRLAWGIGSTLAAVGGLFLGQLQIASTELEGIGLLALPAVVIGGMQSIPGAIVGGLLVGIIEQMASTYISPKSSDIVIYVLLLLILMVRPWGLFGQRELGRV
jgi:branched-chain amino acid transport system permease protein